MIPIATIATVLDINISDPGKLTYNKGNYTLRREYYWRPRCTEQESFASVVRKLEEAGYLVSVLDYGNKWQEFRGGEGVKRNSHIWMKFKLKLND